MFFDAIVVRRVLMKRVPCGKCGAATVKWCRRCGSFVCSACAFDLQNYDPRIIPEKKYEFETLCVDCNPLSCSGCAEKILGTPYVSCVECGKNAHYECTGTGCYIGERVCMTCFKYCECCSVRCTTPEMFCCSKCHLLVCLDCVAGFDNIYFCLSCVRKALPKRWRLLMLTNE